MRSLPLGFENAMNFEYSGAYHRMIRRALGSHVVPIGIFAIIALVMGWNVLTQPGVVLNHDWDWPPYAVQITEYYDNLPYSWWDTAGGGSDIGSSVVSLYTRLVAYLCGTLGLGGDVISKAYLFLIPFLAGTFMFILCKARKSGMSSFMAGLFYMLAPALYFRLVSGHMFPLVSYVLLPLIFLLLLKAIESDTAKGRIRYALCMALLLIFVDQIFSVIICFFVVLYLVLQAGLSGEKEKSLKRSLMVAGPLLLAVAALNAPWLGSVLVEGNGGGQGAVVNLQDLDVRSRCAQLYNVLMLSGNPFLWDWYLSSSDSKMILGMYYVASGVSVAFVWLALLVARRSDRNVMPLCIVALVFLLLSLGSNPPIGGLYEWAFVNIPGFYVFREPYKFAIVTSFAYAYLFGCSYEWLRGRLSKTNLAFGGIIDRARTATCLIVLLICCLLWVGSYPSLTGDFRGNLHSANFPDEYRETTCWLADQEGEFRTAWLPPDPRIQYEWAPYHQADVMAIFSPKPSLVGGVWLRSGPEKRFVNYIALTMNEYRTKHLGKVLGLGNVQYVLLRRDAMPFDWRDFYSDGKELEESLLNQDGIALIKESGAMSVYENSHCLPQVWGATHTSVIAGGYQSLLSLSYFSDTSLGDSVILFADQLSPTELLSVLEQADQVIIQDGDICNLVFPLLPAEYRINPSEYCVHQDKDQYWSQLHHDWWHYYWPYLDTSEEAAFTIGNVALEMPFTTVDSGIHDVWLKLYQGHRGTGLEVSIDDEIIGDIDTKLPNEIGYQWVNLSSDVPLEVGQHSVVIESKGCGENVVAELAIVPDGLAEQTLQNINGLLDDKKVMMLLEAERVAEYTYDLFGSDASQGLTTTSDFDDWLAYQIYMPREGEYTLNVRAYGEGKAAIDVKIDDESRRLDLTGQGDFDWYELVPFHLDSGWHNVQVATDSAYIDIISVESTQETNDESSIDITWVKLNPTSYKAHVEAETPFFLVLNIAYNSSWVAKVDGEEIAPVLAYSFGNAFLIDKTGEFDVSICYGKQALYRIGLFISLGTFLGIVAFLCCGWIVKLNSTWRVRGTKSGQ